MSPCFVQDLPIWTTDQKDCTLSHYLRDSTGSIVVQQKLLAATEMSALCVGCNPEAKYQVYRIPMSRALSCAAKMRFLLTSVTLQLFSAGMLRTHPERRMKSDGPVRKWL